MLYSVGLVYFADLLVDHVLGKFLRIISVLYCVYACV